RSAISRQAVEASVEQMQQLQERRWEGVEILVIYIDGQRFAEQHVISAVGVDAEGQKHILGIEPGATENAAAVKRLLTRLREHGLPTDRQYLFVIDGAKALRAAIEEVFGGEQPVQRCRNHKVRNVLDELPKEQQGHALNLMRAAWKVKTAEEGEQRLEQLARFLEIHTLAVQMKIGQPTTSVEVTESAVALDTTTQTQSMTLGSNVVQNVP